ncbi:hypothetical protein TNCV_4973611 [Trichonephila clavipes]|uniref:Uncharacterized protein n=1 Tax=Trichonephila clavipes TaxID=2585209 RepID=A0A8X6SEQ2_TRICX|nr:hypothetical protein TNCV_4973611 [Trichonephila clavipes]
MQSEHNDSLSTCKQESNDSTECCICLNNDDSERRVPIILTTRPNCDYLVSIEWMRYQRQWVHYCIFSASPSDNRPVEIRPSLESLQFFSYQDIVKNLKHSHSLMEEDESWYHNDIVQVPHVRRTGTFYQGPPAERLFGTREPRFGFGDLSHRSGHLHVFGPDHSRGHAICWRKAPGRNTGPRHD